MFTLLPLLTVLVLQELWEVKEFWDELFDIIGIVHEGLPGCGNGVKLTVSTVKPAIRPTTHQLYSFFRYDLKAINTFTYDMTAHV